MLRKPATTTSDHRTPDLSSRRLENERSNPVALGWTRILLTSGANEPSLVQFVSQCAAGNLNRAFGHKDGHAHKARRCETRGLIQVALGRRSTKQRRVLGW
jgi:hypothetical protein